MAEWVQKGSLMGPQGPKGDDATLPEGGTEGQFLKKTADGETWADAVTAAEIQGMSVINVNGKPLNSIAAYDADTVGDNIPENHAAIGSVQGQSVVSVVQSGHGVLIAAESTSAIVSVSDGTSEVALGSSSGTAGLMIDYKSVTSITDSISGSPTGEALVTDKAVADYVTAHAGDALPAGGTEGQVLTKTSGGEAWADVPQPDIPLPVSQGGTGATTAEGARTALGIPDIEVATDEEFDSYMGLS